jgi:hypothetical protein
MRRTEGKHRISDRKPATVGRHRRPVERVWRPTQAGLRRAAQSRAALATSALTCLALATLAGQVGAAGPTSALTTSMASNAGVVEQVLGTISAPTDPGQSADQLDALESLASAAEEASSAEAASSTEAAVAPVGPPAPVAGLDQVQMNNAWTIVRTGQAMGLPERAYVIAVATAMQESQLRNLASTRIPESYWYNAEGEGSDHDSVGLFQQRPSAGWGAVSQLMDPAYAATAFYQALLRVPGWEAMELTWAAQRVQVSAYPYAYAKHETRAQQVVDAVLAHVNALAQAGSAS